MQKGPKKTTNVWTYVQTGSTLPTYKPIMDKKKVWTSTPFVYPTYL